MGDMICSSCICIPVWNDSVAVVGGGCSSDLGVVGDVVLIKSMVAPCSIMVVAPIYLARYLMSLTRVAIVAAASIAAASAIAAAPPVLPLLVRFTWLACEPLPLLCSILSS